jgi:hypothetical protein
LALHDFLALILSSLGPCWKTEPEPVLEPKSVKWLSLLDLGLQFYAAFAITMSCANWHLNFLFPCQNLGFVLNLLEFRLDLLY